MSNICSNLLKTCYLGPNNAWDPALRLNQAKGPKRSSGILWVRETTGLAQCQYFLNRKKLLTQNRAKPQITSFSLARPKGWGARCTPKRTELKLEIYIKYIISHVLKDRELWNELREL